MWVFMVDDTALDPRIRYCASTNCFLGLCREHTVGLNLKFENYADVELLAKMMLLKKIHKAKEVTVGALASMGG